MFWDSTKLYQFLPTYLYFTYVARDFQLLSLEFQTQ